VLNAKYLYGFVVCLVKNFIMPVIVDDWQSLSYHLQWNVQIFQTDFRLTEYGGDCL